MRVERMHRDEGDMAWTRSSRTSQADTRPVTDIAIRRVDFGYFVRPAEETSTGKPRVEACLGYVVEHPDGVLLFDHCGGNPQLVGRPVFVQAGELAEARDTADYTLPELLDGGRFEELAGETEVLSGVFLIPTPGHPRASVAGCAPIGRNGDPGRTKPRHRH